MSVPSSTPPRPDSGPPEPFSFTPAVTLDALRRRAGDVFAWLRFGRTNFLLVLSALLLVYMSGAPGPMPSGDPWVFTEIPVEEDADSRFPERSRIISVDGDGVLEVLTVDFIAARSPAISYDGKRMLFAARKEKGDDWQIWEMDLRTRRSRRLTDGVIEAGHPVYLPDDRIAFSAAVERGSASEYALHTAGPDGCCVERITFDPDAKSRSTILRDGRILHVSAGAGTSSLFAVRYDGTKSDLIYRSPEASRIHGPAWEDSDGNLFFIEAPESPDASGRLVTIAMKRPLRSRVDLSEGLRGSFGSVHPAGSGELIVSYRPADDGPYALYRFDPVRRRLGARIAGESGYHAIEPVHAAAHFRPLGFVSTVDPQLPNGELLCIDAGASTLAHREGPDSTGVFVRVVTRERVLGDVPLGADGSFRILPPADTPIRFYTLDEAKRIVRGPSAWIWVRPGEQRGCVGCHADPELAPPNVVPDALKSEAYFLDPLNTETATAQRNTE